MKKVAIDLRALQVGHEDRGIGNYLLNILRYFPEKDTRYVVIRYDHSNPVKDYGLHVASSHYDEIVLTRHKFGKSPKKALLFAWGLITPVFSKVKRHKPDIFFQPDMLFGVPRSRRITSVVVAYDVIPLLFRSMYLPHWRNFAHLRQLRLRSRVLRSIRAIYHEKRYFKGLRTLKRADRVISISETTTNDLVNRVGVKRSKIDTILLAPSFVRTNKRDSDKDVERIVSEIRGKYLVFIGGTDPRRQVHELIYAFNILNARGHDIGLVLAGNEFVEKSKELNPKTRKAVENSSYRDKIHMLGRISESDKKLVLENALAFVYPTLYEGFGLPILEAMASKCPVITYDNPATREVGSDVAVFTSSPTGEAIYEALVSLIGDPEGRAHIVKAALKYSKRYDWDDAGPRTINSVFGA